MQQRRGLVAGGHAVARDPVLEHEASQQGSRAARGARVRVGGRAPYGSIQAAPKPLKYDFRVRKVKPLAAGSTLADVQLKLKKKIAAGDIKSAVAVGVTAGSTEEIFVFHALWDLAETARWGTEADILTAIGWPAKTGGPEPQGRVTVRIDDQGAASVELVAAGPVPAPPQTTVAKALTQLKPYKVASIRDDGTTKWTDAEISDVVAALALLPGPDQLALEAWS